MKLILLVGSNSLPNYIAAKVIMKRYKDDDKKKIDKIILIHTKETKKVADRLQAKLKVKYGIEINPIFLKSGFDINSIRNSVKEILKGSHLNYTGGTKIMSTQIYHLWKELNPESNEATYVDDLHSKIIYDNGISIDIEIELNKEEIIRLHNITIKEERQEDIIFSDENIKQMAELFFRKPRISKDLYNLFTNDGQDIKFDEFKKHPTEEDKRPRSEQYLTLIKDENLEFTFVPINDKENFSEIVKFFRGVWLEHFVANKIKEMKLITSVHTGLKGRIYDREFEVDVLAIKKHRLYCVSCTLSSELDRCKLKTFEIIMRSRQLGGDLARCALVCTADPKDVADLEKDVEFAWEAPNKPKIFGKEHIKEWYEGRIDSLKNWLEDK